jgi:predicted outer membrane protein
MSFGRTNWAVAAAGLACLVATSALAQRAAEQRAATQSRDTISERAVTTQDDQATQPGQVRTTQSTRLGERNVRLQAGGQSKEVEKFLAGCLLAKNKCEVEFAQLAQQQSQNPQVKEFAQMLERDHQKIVQQLESLAGGQPGQATTRTETQLQTTTAQGQNDAQRQPSDTARLPGSPGATQTTTRSQTQTDAYSAQEMSGPFAQLAQIEKQIGERQKQTMLDELQQKSGAEFDKCYVGSQVLAHMQSLAALEVISQQQGELAQIAQQAQPTVQQHLDHAKQLAKQLEGSSQAGSQAERQTPPRTQRQ